MTETTGKAGRITAMTGISGAEVSLVSMVSMVNRPRFHTVRQKAGEALFPDLYAWLDLS